VKLQHSVGGIYQKQKLLVTKSEPWIEEWKTGIVSWLEHTHEHNAMDGLKITVYKTLTCHFADINNPSKNIQQGVRASAKWKHREENEIFDFVAVSNNDPTAEGLSAYRMGRLSLLFRLLLSNGTTYDLAGIRWALRVEDSDCILPVYTMGDSESIVPVQDIMRAVHMVPKWDTKIINLMETEKGILANYENMVLNVHADMAMWNYFYDVD
jgi:hypothetical protein